MRQATAKYHDVQVAIVDGCVPTDSWVELPEAGAMGYHLVNPQLGGDLALDSFQSEALVHTPSGNGHKLVALESFVAGMGQDHPTLFDQLFDGPMPGHEPGMPVHYGLHAWIWQPNPAGLFAQWNPNVWR